ncbi:MAG: pantetheine-phosphate adenylyltransferase [Tepidanaerobacteraceae bacterium]|nr:pantetheine-phosphate adenylyltransferase [Tepidanaerobacteraceae bacterium]
MQDIGIYPGSFDPVTLGHLDIIERSSKIFSKLIVSVLTNPSKQPLFTADERVNMLKEAINHITNIEVVQFNGLLVDLAKQKKAKVIIKGLRAVSDFEYEFQMALMNKKLDKNIETVFMMTNTDYSYLSSKIVKEVASLGGCIRDVVPDNVVVGLKEKNIKIH